MYWYLLLHLTIFLVTFFGVVQLRTFYRSSNTRNERHLLLLAFFTAPIFLPFFIYHFHSQLRHGFVGRDFVDVAFPGASIEEKREMRSVFSSLTDGERG